MYRKVVIGLMFFAACAAMSCGGKKRDAAYYLDMVDSIRKAEQVKEIQQKAGINKDPVEAWFDTLNIRTLPIKSVGSEIWELGHFQSVPFSINEHFGYHVGAKLKAMSLPTAYRRPVVLLAEMIDSITPRLYVYTMDKKYQPIDQLLLYEKKDLGRPDDFGQTYTEYYITSKYEITLLTYYQSHKTEKEPELLNSQRYTINREGKFEETVIEL